MNGVIPAERARRTRWTVRPLTTVTRQVNRQLLVVVLPVSSAAFTGPFVADADGPLLALVPSVSVATCNVFAKRMHGAPAASVGDRGLATPIGRRLLVGPREKQPTRRNDAKNRKQNGRFSERSACATSAIYLCLGRYDLEQRLRELMLRPEPVTLATAA
jgi:hypothetical protein